MSSTAALRARFNIVPHVIRASTPSFSLACNHYKRIPGDSSPAALPSTFSEATPPLLFTHANGFHKEIWEPVMARLTPPWGTGDMYAFDCRNQGDSAVLNKDVLENTFDWYSYARDILQCVDTFGLKKPIGVGHSFGASAFILAELIRPGTFSAIVAVDPTMFPAAIKMSVPVDDHPMAQITLRRRDTWKDREEAKAQLLKKPFFQAWHKEAMDIYIEHGLVDAVGKDGSPQVTLKCPKFQEAITFAMVGTGLADAFENLDKVKIPIHLIVGGTSDINPSELVDAKMALIQKGSLDVVEGAGHLVSLEQPEKTANLISTFLDRFWASRKETAETPRARL
ncbi:hypothetical protein EMPS_07236 [Entomortierella parvispora]|uniref:AB hydrolase-1 domain-containing protein n=1 Tax=Entomortierella parvispora TaxID=205924 RepID=A0A9P3HE68_9FUNG|nr:hypothetical protein EMPS_07236 [Entomortierella parvispora]